MGNSACQHALECNIYNPNIRLDQHRCATLVVLQDGGPPVHHRRCALEGYSKEASWATLLASMLSNATSTIPISGWTSTGFNAGSAGVPLFTADGAPLKGTFGEASWAVPLANMIVMQHPQIQFQAGPAQVFNAGGAGRRWSPCSQLAVRPARVL